MTFDISLSKLFLPAVGINKSASTIGCRHKTYEKYGFIPLLLLILLLQILARRAQRHQPQRLHLHPWRSRR